MYNIVYPLKLAFITIYNCSKGKLGTKCKPGSCLWKFEKPAKTA